MTSTVIAARRTLLRMNPCSRRSAPSSHTSARRKASSSAAENGGPPGTPIPAAWSPALAIATPHAARPGRSPITTAGAWAGGVAWKACAPITMPIHSTIASPASIGTAQAIHPTVPVRQMRVTKAPLSTE